MTLPQLENAILDGVRFFLEEHGRQNAVISNSKLRIYPQENEAVGLPIHQRCLKLTIEPPRVVLSDWDRKINTYDLASPDCFWHLLKDIKEYYEVPSITLPV